MHRILYASSSICSRSTSCYSALGYSALGGGRWGWGWGWHL